MALLGLQTAKAYEKEALDRLRRMSIAAADLEIRGSKRPGQGHNTISDKWYDDTMRGMQAAGVDDD